MLESLSYVQTYEWNKENIINHAQKFLNKKYESIHSIIMRVLFETAGATCFDPVIDGERFKRYILPEKNEIVELQNRIQTVLPVLDKSSEEFDTILKIAKEAEERFYLLAVIEKTVDELGQRSLSKGVKASGLAIPISFIAWVTPPLKDRLQSIGVRGTEMFLINMASLFAFWMLATTYEEVNVARINGCRARIAVIGQCIEKELLKGKNTQQAVAS